MIQCLAYYNMVVFSLQLYVPLGVGMVVPALDQTDAHVLVAIPETPVRHVSKPF